MHVDAAVAVVRVVAVAGTVTVLLALVLAFVRRPVKVVKAAVWATCFASQVSGLLVRHSSAKLTTVLVESGSCVVKLSSWVDVRKAVTELVTVASVVVVVVADVITEVLSGKTYWKTSDGVPTVSLRWTSDTP